MGGGSSTRAVPAKGGRIAAVLRPGRMPRLGTVVVVARLRSGGSTMQVRRALIVPAGLAAR